ncbi:MAG: single-stranded DNA-binding protein [Candidatus Pacebacteria bacterium]|nr:single-stranded DNA-binding protein [Candidatus Paceibacterota bacterium]
MNFNKAIIIGRVTRDPEIRTTPNGQTVASIGVASSRVWNNNTGERQEKTEFHNIVAWGRLAEICGQYLVKGQLVLFEGRIETRSWDGQDGVKRYKTEIVAENMQMGPKARSQEGGASTYQAKENTQSAPENSNPQNDEKIVQAEPQNEQSDNNQNANKENKNEEEIKIEDIPF